MDTLLRTFSVGLVLAGMCAPPDTAHANEPAGLPLSAAADGVLLVHVLVPLCDNAQVDCGSKRAGEPGNLDHNLYWGAVFGHRTFALRKASRFSLVERKKGEGDYLERLVVRQVVDGAPWGKEAKVEVLLVLDAFRGDRIDGVVDRFFREAELGATLTIGEADAQRNVPVDVVGYAGHNRMMDGKQPPPPGDAELARPVPSFVLACHSNDYFKAPLVQRRSKPLVLTRQLMAPEGYVLEAIVQGLGANTSRPELRSRAGLTYAKWQSIKESQGLDIFAKLD